MQINAVLSLLFHYYYYFLYKIQQKKTFLLLYTFTQICRLMSNKILLFKNAYVLFLLCPNFVSIFKFKWRTYSDLLFPRQFYVGCSTILMTIKSSSKLLSCRVVVFCFFCRVFKMHNATPLSYHGSIHRWSYQPTPKSFFHEF